MTNNRQKLLDLLAIGRVANLPTVWSNLILGNLLGWALMEGDFSFSFAAMEARFDPGFSTNALFLLILLVGSSCAYLFGTFLNDWKDAEFDRVHRPERAIPSGRLSERAVLGLALLFLALSLLCFTAAALKSLACLVAGILLLGSILLYTGIHKQTPLAVIPMGLCRSLLYLIGALAVFVPDLDLPSLHGGSHHMLGLLRNEPILILAPLALGIFSYVAGLTLAARYESRPEGLKAPRAVFWFLIFLPFLTHTWWWIWERPPFLVGWHLAIPALCGLIPFVVWTIRSLCVLKRSIPDFVSRALAGLCLVDLLAFPGIASFIHTGWHPLDSQPLLLALIPLVLFLLALFLQRLAPAT